MRERSAEALEDADDILKTAIVLDGSGRFGTTVGVPMLSPPTRRQADAHGLAGRTPMDSADLRKPDTRTKGLVTQLVKFLVSQVLDVPLYVQNARTEPESNRDAIADDRPLLDVNSEGARGAIGLQVIDER